MNLVSSQGLVQLALQNSFIRSLCGLNGTYLNQARHHGGWADWRMLKDVKRRKILSKHAVEKLRVNCLRKNDILPKEIQEIADKEIAAFPRDALGNRIQARCAFTSRPRGNVLRWRLSRIVFRDLADHNRIAGIQRAMW